MKSKFGPSTVAGAKPHGRCLKFLKRESPHVATSQEINVDNESMKAYKDNAEKIGYKTHMAASYKNNDEAGGVPLLVRSTLNRPT